MSEYTHRYEDHHEPTSVLPPFGTPEPPRRTKRGRGVAVVVLAGLLGLGGGFAGAAGYDALDDDPPAAAQTTTTTAQGDTTNTNTAAEPLAEGSTEAVAASVLPSVVKINVLSSTGAGSGSGVILSEDGEILTNNHVVDGAGSDARLTVSFNDGSTASARVLGTDPLTDLAVIKAEDVSGLTPATMGDSDQLDVGERVVAIGSPFGLEATVTSGIVSSLNRPVTVQEISGQDTTYPAIQTDAAINPGNSGGPLVDMAGRVVGINSSIRSSSGEGGSIGLGFAIPISKVLPIVDQLRTGETPTHARLGVNVQVDAGQPAADLGAVIARVNPGSAGDDAGLEAGDVVTKVDDHAISGSQSLIATIRGYRPGDQVQLTVQRDDEELTLDATLDSDADGLD